MGELEIQNIQFTRVVSIVLKKLQKMFATASNKQISHTIDELHHLISRFIIFFIVTLIGLGFIYIIVWHLKNHVWDRFISNQGLGKSTFDKGYSIFTCGCCHSYFNFTKLYIMTSHFCKNMMHTNWKTNFNFPSFPSFIAFQLSPLRNFASKNLGSSKITSYHRHILRPPIFKKMPFRTLKAFFGKKLFSNF